MSSSQLMYGQPILDIPEFNGIDHPAVVEKLAKNSLYGEQGVPEKESDLDIPAPLISSALQRKPKGTVVCCYVCGDAHKMLYKADVGYICRTCRRKRDFK